MATGKSQDDLGNYQDEDMERLDRLAIINASARFDLLMVIVILNSLYRLISNCCILSLIIF